MRVYERELAAELLKATRAFPAVVLAGPRSAGKAFLLRRTFPRASHRLLEDPDVLARAKARGRCFPTTRVRSSGSRPR